MEKNLVSSKKIKKRISKLLFKNIYNIFTIKIIIIRFKKYYRTVCYHNN